MDDKQTPEQPTSKPSTKQRRGFAAMTPEKQKAIASAGGKASHALGTGHEWNIEAARAAGRKGGLVSRGGRGKAKDAAPDATSDTASKNA